MNKRQRIFSDLQNLSLQMRLTLIFLFGVFASFAMAPFNAFPLMLLALACLYTFVSLSKSLKEAFVTGWFFGFGYFVAGLWWIANALLVEGNSFTWVWPLAIAGLPALLALFSAIASLLAYAFSNLRALTGLISFTIILSLSEWLRGHIFTGFPWNLYGYSWGFDYNVMYQILSYVGPYFLTALTILWGFSLGYIISAENRRTTIPVLIILLTTFIAAVAISTSSAQKNDLQFSDNYQIKIIQPNIAQKDKWKSKKQAKNLLTLLSLSLPEDANNPQDTLLIWPETALSERIATNPDAIKAIKKTLSTYKGNVILATGLLRAEKSKDGLNFYNSLAIFDKNFELIDLYDKSHLVPFGEYIPFKNLFNMAPFVQLSGFTAGEGLKTLNIPISKEINASFSPLICYEITFPHKTSDKNIENRPDFILNVTNDGWYGNSPGPHQHLSQSRLRAIEEGLPVIRAANTGISAIIAADGTITADKSLLSQGMIKGQLPLKHEISIYKKYGNSFFFTFIFIAIITLMVIRFSTNRRH